MRRKSKATTITGTQCPVAMLALPSTLRYSTLNPLKFNTLKIFYQNQVMPYNVDYGLGDEESDGEGRIITAEFSKFFLICVYVPNSGRKLVTLPKRLRWNTLFMEHLANLNSKKPVIVCGDMNVSHLEIGNSDENNL